MCFWAMRRAHATGRWSKVISQITVSQLEASNTQYQGVSACMVKTMLNGPCLMQLLPSDSSFSFLGLFSYNNFLFITGLSFYCPICLLSVFPHTKESVCLFQFFICSEPPQSLEQVLQIDIIISYRIINWNFSDMLVFLSKSVVLWDCLPGQPGLLQGVVFSWWQLPELLRPQTRKSTSLLQLKSTSKSLIT